jgi:uncharacterized repeat protein (TIGR02543 family)
MIRFSQDNGNTPLLTGEKDKYDVYDKDAAIYHDWYMQKLRSNNFRLFYGLFGFENNIENPPSSERLAFVRYAVDRWAAYVDVWEIFNEENPPDPWLVTIANEIRARDPYDHPISTSWEHAAKDVPEIEITSPHRYMHENELTSDLIVGDWDNYKDWGKPVILGEQGNTDMNWLSDSALRMRLRGWTAFFKELSIIFWETSYATNGVASAGGIANIYLGHEERQYTHILMWFVNQVLKPNSVEASVTVSDDDLMRAYGLSSSDGFAAYIHHYANHTNTVNGEFITINIPQAGQGYWIDPKTGKLLSTVSVNSGSNTLTIPGFVVDIVFFSTASLGDTEPIAHVVIDNPQADGDLDDDGKTDYGPQIMPFGIPPLTLNFNAAGSYDLDGGTVTCSWDYGDGTTGSGASVSHTYPDGVYLTTLTVTDNEGNVSRHSFVVRATGDPNPDQNDSPAFSLASNSITVREGEPVIVTVHANDRELIGSQYVGAPGDLTYSASNLPQGASFGQWKATWSNQLYWVPDVDQAGNHPVQFSVQDAQGASTNPQTINIVVLDVLDNNTNTYNLTVLANNGTVTKNPDKAVYNHGENVTLQANAATGYNFVNWTGDLSGSVNPVTIVMDSNKNITANFGMNPYSLTISAINGYVTKSPDQASYIDGATVTLEAIEDPGYYFVSWSGHLSGSTNPNIITMNSNKSVTANFAAIPETISSATSISGPSSTYVNKTESYTASGASSNLGHNLLYRFDWGDGAISGWGSATQSHQWGGNGTFNIKSQARCESHIGEISAWPDTLRTVTVSYLTLSSSVSPSGTGSVMVNPDKNSYNYNEQVTLQAVPNPSSNYYFTNWSRDLSSSANPATIDMDSDKTITANFAFDGTNPSTNGHIPGKNSDQAARDTIIQLHIADSGSGVEYESVTIQVGGHLIYDGANETSLGIYDSTEGVCRRIGTESDYTFVFQLQPLVMFDYEQKVDVVINATDKAGNDLTENYHFYTVMRTFVQPLQGIL